VRRLVPVGQTRSRFSLLTITLDVLIRRARCSHLKALVYGTGVLVYEW
jgi:hypothetical protein